MQEKRVSWAELFFDLVFVFAITQLSTLLRSDHTWAGLGRTAVVFVPIYWTWVGTAIQGNLQDLSGPRQRLPVFAVALGGMFMALAVTGSYGGRGLLFAASYWIARAILALVIYSGPRLALGPMTVSLYVTGPLLLAGGFVHGDVRVALWAVAGLLDLATPHLFRRRLAGMRLDAGHLAERFALFVLIALGESVVAIGAPVVERTITPAIGGAVAAAFALVTGLWWVYFQYAADAMRFALSTAQVQVTIVRQVLSYGHVVFIFAIITTAVGLRAVVASPTASLPTADAALLYAGAALYLAAFGYTRWAMFRLLSTTRLTAAGVVLLLLPAAVFLPGLPAVALLAATVAVLNAVEYRRVRAQERQAPAQPVPTMPTNDTISPG